MLGSIGSIVVAVIDNYSNSAIDERKRKLELLCREQTVSDNNNNDNNNSINNYNNNSNTILIKRMMIIIHNDSNSI